MHDTFDHDKFNKCLSTKNWFMTYNNCEYIKNYVKILKLLKSWVWNNKSKNLQKLYNWLKLRFIN